MEVSFCQNELTYLQVGSLWNSVNFSHVTWNTAI